MTEPADLGTTYSRAYNAAKRTGPSCCAHVAGLEAVADAAKRRVLEELWELDSWQGLVDRIREMREELDRGDG